MAFCSWANRVPPGMHCADPPSTNRSLPVLEPVCECRKWKLKKGDQRRAAEAYRLGAGSSPLQPSDPSGHHRRSRPDRPVCWSRHRQTSGGGSRLRSPGIGCISGAGHQRSGPAADLDGHHQPRLDGSRFCRSEGHRSCALCNSGDKAREPRCSAHRHCQGRGWIDDIRLGRIASVAEIAKREGRGERHIRLLAPLAFVSPRTIAALLDGTAPADLTVTGLAKALPYSWAEQERSVGLQS